MVPSEPDGVEIARRATVYGAEFESQHVHVCMNIFPPAAKLSFTLGPLLMGEDRGTAKLS
jgi:hypothetical protein